MNRVLLVLTAVLAAIGWPLPSRPSTADVSVADLSSYVIRNYMSPKDYIVSQFALHDVVFVGEFHRIRHDPELIQRILPLLPKVGVFTLCTEFARREDQPLLDKLLEGRSFDESLARQLLLGISPPWGYQEYLDILKTAWAVNSDLPGGARKLRLLGLSDSLNWCMVEKPEDMNQPDIWRKIGVDESQWAKVILGEVVAKGDKALVYCGINHAFTEYRQPVVDTETHCFKRFSDKRAGNYVYDAIGKRAITIFLDSPWISAAGYEAPLVYPANRAIDTVVKALPMEYRNAGFNTRGTPFAHLPASNSIYCQGYPNFCLATFCDGYVVQGPLSECEGATTIPAFINDGNVDLVRISISNPRARFLSAEQIMAGMSRDANRIPEWFSMLE